MANQDFRVKNGLKVGIKTDETYSVTVTTNGNIGIGSTIPQKQLDIVGSASIDGSISIGATITANTINASGDGLTNIPGGQLTGTISSERLSGTYYINVAGDGLGSNTLGVGTADVVHKLNIGAGNTGVFASSNGNISISGVATVSDGVSVANTLTAGKLSTGNNGIGIGTDTITGPVSIIIDPVDPLDNPQSYTVTSDASSGPADYVISGSDRVTTHSSSSDPTITIRQGDTITFNNNALGGSHPLFIKDSPQGSNVSNPAASGAGTSIITWTPTTVGTYYYECSSHPNAMIGIIEVTSSSTSSGALYIKGDLYVEGTQFQVDSGTVNIADKVIGIATTATSNVLLDGAGIGIGSDANRKTFLYEHNSGTNPSLKSSENINVASGKHYQIGESQVLNATTLGSSVVNSSLTGIGIITSGTWNGSVISDAYIGTISSVNKISLSALNVDGGTAVTSLTQDDLFIIDDGAGGTNRKITAANAKNYFTLSNTGYADTAGVSTTSGYATNAGIATYAGSAGVSTNASKVAVSQKSDDLNYHLVLTDLGAAASYDSLYNDSSNQNLKYNPQTNKLTISDSGTLGIITGAHFYGGNFSGSSFSTIGGTSSQFLKADGSVDSSTYLTSESDTLNSVVGRGNSTTSGILVQGMSLTRGDSSATRNTGLGFEVLSNIASGEDNIGLGYNALKSTSNGNRNIGIGRSALASLSIGSDSIGIGEQALKNLVNGSTNISIGNQSGSNTPSTSSNNIFIGYKAGYATSIGNGNLLIGNSIMGEADLTNSVIIGNGNGDERIRIDSGGNVGIGTSGTVNAKFQVVPTNSSGISIASTDGSYDAARNGGIDSLDAYRFMRGATPINVSIKNSVDSAGINFTGSEHLNASVGNFDNIGTFSIFSRKSTDYPYSAAFISGGPIGMYFGTPESSKYYFYETVGLGSEAPKLALSIGNRGEIRRNQDGILTSSVVSFAGTFTASVGTATTIDTINITSSTENLKTVEYTINIENSNNIQAQKVLVMHNGASAYSQEYGIMYAPNQIVSIGATVVGVSTTSNELRLELTPLSGITGLTTYRVFKGGLY